MAKSIIDIDVNDGKFKAFKEQFDKYKQALDAMPDAWAKVGEGTAAAAGGFDAAGKEAAKTWTQAVNYSVKGVQQATAAAKDLAGQHKAGADQVERSRQQQEKFTQESKKGSSWLSTGAKASKDIAGHIKDATLSLLKWSGLVGIISGLTGAGGLFGINRMALSAANTRLTSQGLGISAGELNAAAIDYSKAVRDPGSTLGAIRDAQYDLTKRWAFSALGINPTGQDPMSLMGPMIKASRQKFISAGSTQQGAEANGLLNFFSMDDLIRFKNMSESEIDAMVKKADADRKSLSLSDQTLRSWQNFELQLRRSGTQIENTFISGLLPLSGPLAHLSDAFNNAVADFMKSPQVGKFIEDLNSCAE
ncbi:hypothetical protein [Martelella alba]|uniref:Uncharacterized protein n=1 Tax=Martelella alba TaxID=2590451 RepID=A0ABY2SFS9_9HYPH|nr:hypothetical protein [Martelella alba]TKI02742.1 hypothetical protein FCN80_24175 [Martelella alba]